MSTGTLSIRAYASLVSPAAFVQTLLPRVLKSIFWGLILVNIRSFPLSWHFRVFRPVFYLRFRLFLQRLRLLTQSRRVKETKMDEWFASLSPVGADPFDMTTIYTDWAGPEDCDFNWHLSNSCYPKILDAARFKGALAMFPNLFPVGGWIALAGTYHNFVREIPMFSKYELRMNLGSWDNKWFYVVIRFVSHSKPKKDKRSSKGSPPSAPTPAISSTAGPFPSLHTPGTPFSDPSTPANPVVPDPSHSDPTSTVNATMKSLAAAQMRTEEPDGATLHCVSVSQLCFKHGRITIPPALVIAMNGFCLPPPSSTAPSYAAVAANEATDTTKPVERYSLAHPPPHWAQVKSLAALSNRKAFRDFLRGGWRSVPEDERWWEQALGGSIETRRKERLEVLGKIRAGIDGVREL